MFVLIHYLGDLYKYKDLHYGDKERRKMTSPATLGVYLARFHDHLV